LSSLDTFVGIVAAICTTASYVPQLQKSWATGQTDDLSLRMLIVLMCGLSLWVLYGFFRDDIVIIGANGISVTLLATILYLKIKCSRGGAKCEGRSYDPK
jgi:MtN3 and saliva related transmembrane protein